MRCGESASSPLGFQQAGQGAVGGPLKKSPVHPASQRVHRLQPVFRIASFALALGAVSACCQSETLGLDSDFPQIDSRLALKASGRERLYSLPRCCWPDHAADESSLPDRSGEALLSGLDALSADRFALLANRSFALLTNATGRDRELTSGLELMVAAGVPPALLLEPEHGLYGHLDRPLDGFSVESRYGIRILSLYSERKRPRPQDLEGVDLIVVDLDNLPIRCYTYISSLSYIMEVAEQLNIELMILDRPNPYGFWRAQGAFLREEYRSFISEAPVPFLYSLSPGEYARYLAAMRLPRLRLSVVEVAGYSRDDADAPLRRGWINPSPNIPSMEAALVYPAIVFFEGIEYSLGRGTTRPFVYSGAPWLDSARVVAELRALKLPGVQIAETTFEPQGAVFSGETCRGVQIIPTSERFDPLRTGYEYMRIVRRLHPEEFKLRRGEGGRYWLDLLWGGDGFRRALEKDQDYEAFRASWQGEADAFERLVQRFRLY